MDELLTAAILINLESYAWLFFEPANHDYDSKFFGGKTVWSSPQNMDIAYLQYRNPRALRKTTLYDEVWIHGVYGTWDHALLYVQTTHDILYACVDIQYVQCLYKIWTKSIIFSIKQLSSRIKDIVDEYGVSILTSGTGLSAVSTPISGAMMLFSGAIAQDDLENAYGGDLNAEEWVFSRFVQGEGLSVPLITNALEAYVEATHKKWPDTECELRRTEASDPIGKAQKMSEEVYTKKLPGCVWRERV
ncbi:hypothetical protein DER44DRAFT_748486 [Fusarium oxysporum]|nr:hypothetical protein DER44DRAFT_748486 [Fusarium oxysporum]